MNPSKTSSFISSAVSSSPSRSSATEEEPLNFYQNVENKTLNNIEELKKKYPDLKVGNQLGFRIDAMIVALKSAKKVVSTRIGLNSSVQAKKDTIDSFIQELKLLNVKEQPLNKEDLDKLGQKHENYLNTQRATTLKTGQTRSGQVYLKIMSEANIYVETMYTSRINALQNNRLSPSDNYEIFKYLFINATGVLADPEEVRTQSMTKAITQIISSNNITRENKYEIFKLVFIDQVGVFADQEDPRTKAIAEAITMVVKMGDFSLDNNFEIFKNVFIDQKGVFANQEDPRTKAMAEAITQVEKIASIYQISNYEIFKHVFINPKGIFINREDPRSQEMAVDITQDVKKGRLRSEKKYEIFKDVFIDQVGVFADQKDPRTKAMAEAITQAIEITTMDQVYNYEIFKHVFINPVGIFIDPNDPRSQVITKFIIQIVKTKRLSIEHYYEIFKQIFIEPTGVFADPNDSRSKAMTEALTHSIAYLLKKNKLTELAKRAIFDHYVKTDYDIRFKIFETALVEMLIKNELQEPEVIHKIATHLANGAINIPVTGQGISFFIKLSNTTNIPLLGLLSNNLDYFIAKDGLDYIEEILSNVLLIKPLQQSAIEQLVENQLINQLQGIKKDANVELIREVILPQLRHNEIENHLKQTIKQQIKQLSNGINEKQIKLLNDHQVDQLFTAINNIVNIKMEQVKIAQIKQAIRNNIFNNADLTDPQESQVNIFAKSLITIDIKQIQKQYIHTNYLQMLGITADKWQAGYEVFSNYLPWDKAIDNCKQNKLKEISERIINNDEKIKAISLEVYCSYVLNTLPYRSYLNILAILANNQIPEAEKRKLQLVAAYCQLNELDVTDDTALNLFLVEDKQTKEDYLISLQNLDYLNGKNIKGFTLEQIWVNIFTNNHYAKLEGILSNNSSVADNDEIDCSTLDTALFNNLQQLGNNNNHSEELLQMLFKFIETKKITKANLNKFITNDIVKLFLKEVAAQPLGFNHFVKISFPQYLQALIRDKFTAANIVAKHISLQIKDIVVRNNFKITLEQKKKLEEICYQVALAPGKEVTIPLDFKKKLIENFNDFSLITSETEITHDNGEKQQIAAGDFIQVKRHLEEELTKLANKSERLEKLPELLVTKAEQLAFTVDSKELIDGLFNELNNLPSLKGKISKHEIAYILGVIFMDMSSIHALGYHSDSENVAFARFRLLGAYWLAKALQQNNSWTAEQQKVIAKEIGPAILTIECSGQIINRLYGTWCSGQLKDIFNKAQSILQAKAF